MGGTLAGLLVALLHGCSCEQRVAALDEEQPDGGRSHADGGAGPTDAGHAGPLDSGAPDASGSLPDVDPIPLVPGAFPMSVSMAGNFEFMQSLSPVDDNGVIMTGLGYNFDVDPWRFFYWIMRVGLDGQIKWSRRVGTEMFGAIYDVDDLYLPYFVKAVQAEDGGIYVMVDAFHGQYFTGNVLVMKFSRDGNIEWQAGLTGAYFNFATDIVPAYGGGVVIAGNREKGWFWPWYYTNTAWLVNVTRDGGIGWQRAIEIEDNTEISAIDRDPGGGYVLGGVTNHRDENKTWMPARMWFAKTDGVGNASTASLFESTGWMNIVKPMPDGSYFLGAFSSAKSSGIIKIAPDGGIKTIATDYYVYSVEPVSDGGNLLAGNGHLIKLAPDDSVEWITRYGQYGFFNELVRVGGTLVMSTETWFGTVRSLCSDGESCPYVWFLAIGEDGRLENGCDCVMPFPRELPEPNVPSLLPPVDVPLIVTEGDLKAGTTALLVSDMDVAVGRRCMKADAMVTASPGRVVFADTAPGCGSKRNDIVIHNYSADPAFLMSAAIDRTPPFTITEPVELPVRIEPGGDLQLTTEYMPEGYGDGRGTLSLEVYSMGETSTAIEIELSGVSRPNPDLVDFFEAPPRPRLDVVVCVDTSPGMKTHQEKLAQLLADFLTVADLDWQLLFLTPANDAPVTTPTGEVNEPGQPFHRQGFPEAIANEVTPVHPTYYDPVMETGETRRAAINANGTPGEYDLGIYPGCLEAVDSYYYWRRWYASRAVIILSNRDDSILPYYTDSYMRWADDGVPWEWDGFSASFSVIAAFDRHGTAADAPKAAACAEVPGSEPSNTYLAALTAAGLGTARSICLDDWDKDPCLVVPCHELARPPREYMLSRFPRAGSITVSADGVPIPEGGEGGYHWNLMSNSINFGPAVVLPPRARIEVRYSALCASEW
ncbi:MAG: hypothetical protein HY897_21430 [Deltaproteobacteria bacterium]|nr:hypothetical protein [Deltaproteobacteria bacterium]